jgi:signal transduction histidine kinase
VVDTGIGIPPAEQERLFERFFRTAAANPNAIQGTGLGLSIAKAITEGHAGTIELYSSGNEGTTFRLTLPLAS